MKKPVLIYIISAISILVAIGAIVFSLLTVISAYKPLDYIAASAATCTEQGNIDYYKNPKNGLIYSDNKGEHEIEPKDIIIPALGHDLIKVEAKAPTNTQDGNREYYHCKRCGNNYEDELGLKQLSQVIIPAYNTRGLEYQILNERFCCVKIINDAPSEVTIDAIYEHDGISYTVQKIIADDAGGNHDKVTSIELPNTVEDIEENAFKGFSKLKSITFGDNSQLYSIGERAFEGCAKLTSITIPASVTSIGIGAFSGCISLASITLPFVGNGVDITYFGYIFGANSYSDNSNYVPDSLRTIVITGGEAVESNAFYNCTSLESITLPQSVTSIGWGIFSGCSNLKSLTVPYVGYSYVGGVNNYEGEAEVIEPIGWIFGAASYEGSEAVTQHYYGKYLSGSNKGQKGSFWQQYYIPQTLKNITVLNGEICVGAFNNCTNLKSITIGEGVTAINNNAFKDCTSLESIEIPDGVTSIGELAFEDCESLESINISADVTSIGDSAFYNCNNIKGVYITDLKAWCNIEFGNPDANPLCYYADLYLNNNLVAEITADMLQGVTEIKKYAFYNCTSLTSIDIPDSVTSIGVGAFYNCTHLESMTLPFVGNGSNETHFGYIFGAFYEDNSDIVPTSLKTVVITGGSTIDGYAFYKCTSLESITIPNSVTSISGRAFCNCESLESIEIPDSVTSIGWQAFLNCYSLTSITIPASVNTIGQYVFAGCDKLSNVTFVNKSGWKVAHSSDMSGAQPVTITDDSAKNASLIKKTYCDYYWKREEN